MNVTWYQTKTEIIVTSPQTSNPKSKIECLTRDQLPLRLV